MSDYERSMSFRNEAASSVSFGRGSVTSLVAGPSSECRLSAMMAESLRPEAVTMTSNATGSKGSTHSRVSGTGKGALPWFRAPATAAAEPSGASAPSVSPPSPPNSLALRSLTVEETILLRDVFDTWTEAQPVPTLVSPGDDTSDNFLDGFVSSRGRAMYQPLYLDVFHVTALLSRAGIVVPAGNDLRKIVAKVQSLNVNRTETVSATSSAYLYPAGTDLHGPRAPVLSFEMFCQVAELTKRLVMRNRDTSTDVGETFSRIVRNKPRLSNAGGSRRQSSLSPGACSSLPGATSVESLCLDSFDAAPTLQIEASKSSKSTIPVSLLEDMLRQAGAEFDLLTLLRSLKKDFDGSVDSDAFRWITGSEDPDIVKAFVALGGEQSLSGSIPTAVLIAKCAAMKMSPQAVANFVAKVDANGDGHVDYNEFVSMIVQQKMSQQEPQGLTDGAFARSMRVAPLPSATPDANTPQTSSVFPFQTAPTRPQSSYFKQDDSAGDDEALELDSDGSSSDSLRSGSNKSLNVEEIAAMEGPKVPGHEPTATHHLRMGLSDLLASSLKITTEKTLQQRIEAVVSKGRESVVRCRNRAEACADEREARPVCLIRTDEGLVDATRSAEPALLQRARLKRLKQQAEEQIRMQSAAPVSPRLTALPKRRVQLLEQRVKSAADDLRQQEAMAVDRAARRAAIRTSLATPAFAAIPPARVHAKPRIITCATKLAADDPIRISAKSSISPQQERRPRVDPADVREELRIIPANQIYVIQQRSARQQVPLRPSSVMSAARPRTVTPSAVPQKSADAIDDQLLWKLLDYNYYGQKTTNLVKAEGPEDTSRYLSSVAARRIYARTVASHLALQLPYDDELMIGEVAKCITPMALRTAVVSRAYTARPGSSSSYASRSQSTAEVMGAPSSVSPLVQAITVPSRPTTAPSRRPTSATARGATARPPSSRLRTSRDDDDDDDSDTMYLS